MKLLAKSIDMYAIFDNDSGKDGNWADKKINPPIPYSFRIKEKNSDQKRTIKVDRMISWKEEKSVGKPVITYACQSKINGVLRQYELRYIISDMKWQLYKM